MKMKPYAAFSYAVIHVRCDAGDERVVELGVDGLITSGYYFYTKGLAKVKVIETNEELQDRIPGWLNYEHPDAKANSTGNLLLSFPVETEWVCISHKHNKNGLPTLSSLVLKSGEKTNFINNTNFWLARGQFEINTKIFTGPCQVRVRSGDVEVQALDKDCYGLFFT
jgi:hypothetical protein